MSTLRNSSRARRLSYAARFALVLWLWPACVMSVHAQNTQSAAVERIDPPGYSALIEQALSEHEAQHFEEAHAYFARAHAIFPNARTLRGLGMMEFELRDYRACVEHLQQALASDVRPLSGELREEVSVLLARAQGFLGTLALSVDPRDASVRIDGAEVVLDGQPLQLNFGEHSVDVRAPGFARETQKVTVRAGETKPLHVALSAEPTPQAQASAPSMASHDAATPSSGPSPLAWLFVGAGGALMVSGVVLLALAQSDVNQVEDASRGTRWAESMDAYDAAPVKSGVGFALLGVGAVGVTAGLIWALGGKHEASVQGKAKPLHFALGPTRVALSGAF